MSNEKIFFARKKIFPLQEKKSFLLQEKKNVFSGKKNMNFSIAMNLPFFMIDYENVFEKKKNCVATTTLRARSDDTNV